MAPVKTTQGTFRYRVTSPSLSRDNLLVESENKASALPCVRLPTRKISFGHRGEQLYALFYALQSPQTFSLSQYFHSLLTLLFTFVFFFCFYTRYQKARLLSPTTTGALPYRLEHSLTLQEKLVRTSSGEVKIKYAAWHTQTHTHTHTYILRTSWGFAVVLVGEGGDEWGGGGQRWK